LEELGLRRGFRTIPDYNILLPGGRALGFVHTLRTPVFNLLDLARQGLYRMSDILGTDAMHEMDAFLRYDPETTYARYDHVTYAEFASRNALPPSLRLVFNTFSRAFFADPERMSMAELIKSFHFYYLSHDGGLLYDYPTDDFEPALLARLGLPARSFDIHGLEFHGRLSFLKAGLYYADCITTVSPTYAREIQQEPLGFGFQGLLAARSSRLHGILNGIDTDTWNPSDDPNLAACFDEGALDARAANRLAVQQRFGLERDAGAMLLGVVSRFTEQKGIDLILDAWPGLAERHRLQLAMLGSGDRQLTRRATDCVRRHPGRVGFIDGFDEPLSHLIEGGCDAFLMPSRFEPCGLNQMYSQRYGAPPIVRATGGLADSVTDDPVAGEEPGTGFVFAGDTPAALAATVERAFTAWQDRPRWRRLQQAGMQRDFGWQASATSYAQIYRQAIAHATAATRPTARSSSRVRTDA
jgi:glycosyltransferase involved in cell wall biosynthesis